MASELLLDATSPRFRITPELEGVDVSLRFYWQQIAAGWYLDVLSPDGDPVARGIRIEPGALIPWPGGYPSIPPGRLIAQGPSPYQQADLGAELRVYYLTAAEVEGG